MRSNNSIITQIETSSIKKSKEILYIVLKEKPISEEVKQELEIEIENMLVKFIQSISPKLQNMYFENKEQSLKVIILKGLINILQKMIEEHKMQLSESDQKALQDIMKEEEDKLSISDDFKSNENNTQRNNNSKPNNNQNNHSNNNNNIQNNQNNSNNVNTINSYNNINDNQKDDPRNDPNDPNSNKSLNCGFQ